jgi:hypothetical protein
MTAGEIKTVPLRCKKQPMKRRNYLSALLQNKCPRCRRGDMFVHKNPYRLKDLFKMYPHCPVCKQRYELEIGFWYGTGYVSYALTVAFSAVTLVLYWLIFGISIKDNSIYWWLIANSALLLLALPFLIRFSRTLYLAFFVHYDPETEKIRETGDKG